MKAALLGLWNLRARLLAAVSLGAAVGLGAYLAGPWLSALAGDTAGFAVGLYRRARGWLQQVVFGGMFPDTTS